MTSQRQDEYGCCRNAIKHHGSPDELNKFTQELQVLHEHALSKIRVVRPDILNFCAKR